WGRGRHPRIAAKPAFSRADTRFCAAYKGGPLARQCDRLPIFTDCKSAPDVKKPHNSVSLVCGGRGLVYKASMFARSPPDQARGPRCLLLLAAIVALAGIGYFAVGTISIESLVRYRSTIDAFIASHSALSVLAYIGLYVVAVALSLPGAAFLTVVGGFLFGV